MSLIPPGVRSSTEPLDRMAASRDLWPGGTLDLWQGRPAPLPATIAWPETEAQLADVLRRAAEAGVPVVPYGAGSGVCGGARGVEGALVVDTKAFDRIGPIDAERWSIDVGAGVIGQHLEDHLAARGWCMGHSPSSIGCSSVGGWAAARSAGQFSSRYGVFEDMLLSLRVVTPGRGVLEVGDGGDAPADWLPLLLGSEGTLGVVTSVRMRVWPAPKARWLRGYRFASLDDAITGMRRLMQGELWPSVVRLYDPVDTRIGGRTRPKSDESGNAAFYRRWLEALDGMPAVRRRLLALPLAIPGVVNRIFDGMASGCLLIVGWEGEPAVVEALSSAGHALLCETAEDLGAAPGERWFASRHAVSYKLMPIFERGGFADTMEVACRWSSLADVYHAVRAALGRTAIVMAHMSHLYPEGGSIYFSFAGRGDADVYRRTWAAGLEAVLAAGGTVTHHHGVGALKAEAASREIGPAIAGWRALKAELDPRGVLNPGRLFVDVPPADVTEPRLAAEDGLVRAPARSSLAERAEAARLAGGEPMFPWERVPARPRWQRNPWQIEWTEVAGRIGGVPCVLGRGPRSASGSDLRGWLADRDPDATATFPVAADGPRWMGIGRPERPWRVALELLRGDLRPAVLDVRDGELRVGFRGPAAAALGALASARVPGGLAPVAYAPAPLPAGPLVACDPDDPATVAVTLQGAWRRAEGA